MYIMYFDCTSHSSVPDWHDLLKNGRLFFGRSCCPRFSYFPSEKLKNRFPSPKPRAIFTRNTSKRLHGFRRELFPCSV